MSEEGRHISYSQIREYLRCPYLWGLHRLKNIEPAIASDAAMYGRAMHETLSRYSSWHKQTGSHDPEVIHGFWYMVTEDPEVVDFPLTYESYVRGIEMVKRLVSEGQLDLSSAVEFEVRLTVDFGGDLDLIAILDRIDDLGAGHYRIVDYKSDGFYTQSILESNMQLSIYGTALAMARPDKVFAVSVAIQNLTTGEFTEVMKLPEQIADTLQFVRNMAHRIFTDEHLRANPGKSCLQYGGCWAADECEEHKNTKILAAEGSIDLTNASDASLLKWYTSLEYWRHMIQTAMKERLNTGSSSLQYQNRVAKFRPVFSKIPNVAALSDLFALYSQYGFTCFSSMTLSERKLQSTAKRVANAIGDDESLSELEKQAHLKNLWELVALAYTEAQTGRRFQVSEVDAVGDAIE